MDPVHLTQEEKHKLILSEFTFDEHKQKSYDKKKVARARSMVLTDGVKIPRRQEEVVSDTGRSIYPEFVEYCYFLEGSTKKLLFYLLFHNVDTHTCEFIFNDQIIAEFRRYDAIMTSDQRPDSSHAIKKSLRRLVKDNIITNVCRGKYMLNPMLMGGSSSSERRQLLSVYSLLLLSKNKNGVSDFFPNNSI